VFKVSPFRLDTRAQTGAPLSDCRINSTLIKFTVTSRWERRYTVKAVDMVDNSGSTLRSIISCIGPEIFVQIDRILTKFCPWKLGVLVIMTYRVFKVHVLNDCLMNETIKGKNWLYGGGCIRVGVNKILQKSICVIKNLRRAPACLFTTGCILCHK